MASTTTVTVSELIALLEQYRATFGDDYVEFEVMTNNDDIKGAALCEIHDGYNIDCDGVVERVCEVRLVGGEPT